MKQITAILPKKQTVACVINNHFFSLFILRQTLSAALMGLREQNLSIILPLYKIWEVGGGFWKQNSCWII